jgi:hypothetical protein
MFNNLGQWTPNPSQQNMQPQQNAQNGPMQASLPMQQNYAPPSQPMSQLNPNAMNFQMQLPQHQGPAAYQQPPSPQGMQAAWWSPQNMAQNGMMAPQTSQSEQQVGNSGSPANVSNYLAQLQQSNAGQYNNQQMQAPQQQQAPGQGFQGYQGFNGGTLNNLQGLPNPNQYNQANYNPWMAQGNNVNNPSNGNLRNMPTFAGPPVYGPGNYQGYTTSDENAKENINPGEDELSEFLNSLGIYSYEYKDKKDGEGRRISPMAQEIIKSPLGEVAISKDERGYMKVDYGKLMGTMLSSIAMDHQKIKELEERIKKAMKLKGNKNGE